MRTHLAWLLLEQDRPQESLPHFQHLSASGLEDKNIGMGLAISYLKLKQPKEAVAVLDRTLAYHPDDPVVLKLLGEALLTRQETAERALQVFTRLSQRFPDNQEWHRRQEEARASGGPILLLQSPARPAGWRSNRGPPGLKG